MVYAEGGSRRTRIVDTSAAERESFVLDDEDILQLARWAVLIEQHYSRPMDMEWAKHGETGELYIVQARPETVQATGSATALTLSAEEEGDGPRHGGRDRQSACAGSGLRAHPSPPPGPPPG